MKTLDLGTAPTGRLLWHTALPSIVSMLLVALYHGIDRIFIGHAVGTLGLAAMTVALPIMMLGFAGTLMAHAGGGSLIGRLLGAGDMPGASHALGQTLLLSLITACISALLCWLFLEPLLYLFGASPASVADARTFSSLMILAFPIQAATVSLDCGLWAQGRPKTALLVILVGVLVNTALCALFVLQWGWGVAGSAWATVLGELTSLVIVLVIYRWGKLPLQLRWRSLRWNTAHMRELVQVGSSSGLSELLPVLLLILLNQRMSALVGDVGLALVGVFESLWMLTMMPVFGITQAAAVVMSFNHGANQPERVRRVLWQCWASASVVLVLAWACIVFAPQAVIHVFAGGAADLQDLGQYALPIYFLALPLLALPLSLAAYYRSIGQGLPAALLSLSHPLLFLMPALWLGSHWWGLDGLLWATPVADALVLLLSGVFLWRLVRTKTSVVIASD